MHEYSNGLSLTFRRLAFRKIRENVHYEQRTKIRVRLRAIKRTSS